MRTTRSRWSRSRLLVVVVTALVALASACGGGGDGDEEASTGAPPSTEATTTTEAATPDDEGTTTTDEGSGDEEEQEPEPEEEEPESRTADDYDYQYQDAFVDSDWVTGCNDRGCAGLEDGHFYEDIYAGKKEIDQLADWDGLDFFDVGVQVTIVNWGQGGPQGGVVCFADPDAGTYYDLTVSADGVVSIYRFEDGSGTALANEARVTNWDRDRPATLLAGCTETGDGISLSLSVDGRNVAQVTDFDPLPAGEVGLITYGDPDLLSTVWYDDLSVVGDLA